MRTPTLRYLTSATVAVIMAATMAGCGSDSPKKASDNKPLEKVTYVNAVGYNGREAYAWVAAEKGYFRDAGLEVDIKPGAASDANLKALASDQTQYTAIDITGGMIQIGSGAFTDFRAFAVIHQRTMLAFMTTDKSGITTPKDLEGKTVVEPTGSVWGKLFPTYAKLAGFDSTKVKWSGAPTPQLPALLVSGKADAIGYPVVGKPTVDTALAGRKVVTLPFDQYLTDLYGTALVTSTKTIKSKPDQVRRFRKAMMRGLEYSIAHPQETAEILHKVQPTADEKVATAEVEILAQYAKGGSSLGAYDQSRVARSIAILQGAGAVPPGLTPEQVFDWSVKS